MTEFYQSGYFQLHHNMEDVPLFLQSNTINAFISFYEKFKKINSNFRLEYLTQENLVISSYLIKGYIELMDFVPSISEELVRQLSICFGNFISAKSENIDQMDHMEHNKEFILYVICHLMKKYDREKLSNTLDVILPFLIESNYSYNGKIKIEKITVFLMFNLFNFYSDEWFCKSKYSHYILACILTKHKNALDYNDTIIQAEFEFDEVDSDYGLSD